MAQKIIDFQSLSTIENSIPELTSYHSPTSGLLPISLNVNIVDVTEEGECKPLIQLLTTDGDDILPEPLPREEVMSLLWKVIRGLNDL